MYLLTIYSLCALLKIIIFCIKYSKYLSFPIMKWTITISISTISCIQLEIGLFRFALLVYWSSRHPRWYSPAIPVLTIRSPGRFLSCLSSNMSAFARLGKDELVSELWLTGWRRHDITLPSPSSPGAAACRGHGEGCHPRGAAHWGQCAARHFPPVNCVRADVRSCWRHHDVIGILASPAADW